MFASHTFQGTRNGHREKSRSQVTTRRDSGDLFFDGLRPFASVRSIRFHSSISFKIFLVDNVASSLREVQKAGQNGSFPKTENSHSPKIVRPTDIPPDRPHDAIPPTYPTGFRFSYCSELYFRRQLQAAELRTRPRKPFITKQDVSATTQPIRSVRPKSDKNRADDESKRSVSGEIAPLPDKNTRAPHEARQQHPVQGANRWARSKPRKKIRTPKKIRDKRKGLPRIDLSCQRNRINSCVRTIPVGETACRRRHRRPPRPPHRTGCNGSSLS